MISSSMIVKGCNSQTRCAGHSFINSIYILKEQLSRVWNHQPSMDRGHIKIRPLCSSQMMRHPLGQGNVLPHRRQSHSTYPGLSFLAHRAQSPCPWPWSTFSMSVLTKPVHAAHMLVPRRDRGLDVGMRGVRSLGVCTKDPVL